MKIIRSPTKDEFIYIKKVSENDPRKKVRQRAKILLKIWKGQNAEKISKKLVCSKTTIYSVVKRWNKNGIGTVVTWRQTHSWRKGVNRRQAIEKLINTSPRSLRLHFTTWSVRKLSVFITMLVDYFISPSTVWKDLKLLGLSYKKIQDSFLWKPPGYDIFKAELRLLKHLLPPNYRLLYVDEKGPVHALRHSGFTWSFERMFREKRQKSLGKIQFLGGYNPKTRDLSMVPMEEDSSWAFCQAMDWIRLHFLKPPFNQLVIVLDNDSIHKSHYTRNFFKDDPSIDLIYLPPYSPELNPIEICFKHYQNEKLNNGTFSSIQQLIDETEDFARYYSNLRCEIFT